MVKTKDSIFPPLTPEHIADKVAGELERICKKYNCEIGVWLSWRDLLYNFELMKKEPTLDECRFGLQIRVDDVNTNQNKEGDKSTVK